MTAGYEFDGGFPTPGTVQRAYDEADLNRAVQCYRLFFASVSGLAIFKGNEVLGLVDNEVFGTLETQPKHVGLTLNSDTPYAPLLLDLQAGPMVIELPPGPLICIAMDLNQRWVMDMGLPGPTRGRAGGTCCCRPATRGTCRRVTSLGSRAPSACLPASGPCRSPVRSTRPANASPR
jgi:hypothetical protein